MYVQRQIIALSYDRSSHRNPTIWSLFVFVKVVVVVNNKKEFGVAMEP